MATSEWVSTEITYGRCKITNGDIVINVLTDFSGQVENDAGDFFEFKDLRDFIRAAKLLEEMLVEHYGGWE